MGVATLEGAEKIMTDYQFKAILSLVIKVLRSTRNIDDAISYLESLKNGTEKAGENDRNSE
ncbi:MAG: hypothetical protein LBO82_04805 [Synergistaceae bacterium]|jgi:hypothetical protein|nr:hypothetical protein [Synergistaceae bacterium]